MTPQRIAEVAAAIVAKHVERARKAVSGCPKWSPAQAEWSRARDLGLDIQDELSAALRAIATTKDTPHAP